MSWNNITPAWVVSKKKEDKMITKEDMEHFAYWEPEEVSHYPQPSEYVGHYYKTAGIAPDPDACASFVMEEHNEWLDEEEAAENNPEAELKELADKVFTEYGYALARGWNLNEALYRVFKNNMTRMVWDDGEVHRDPTTGKILKNPNTPKVFLGDLV